MSNESAEPAWGRVLLAGGSDWATNGLKNRKHSDETDLLGPHILRSLCHVKVTKILAGCSSNYAIAIDIRGTAHIFGKVPGLGPESSKGVIPSTEPLIFAPRAVGHPELKWVDGVLGRYHFFLLDSNGGVWACGNNSQSQLGLPASTPSLSKPTQIKGPWVKAGEKIVQVTAGWSFSLFLTDSGKVYATGSTEHGQLGNGTTGERLIKAGTLGYDRVLPRLVKGDLEGKKVIQIASGAQHSLALVEGGHVYAWGYAGFSRLGLGDQNDKLVPTLVPMFSGRTPAVRVFCGPSSSVVIDKQSQFNLAGKWKVTGDGSSGQPWTYFKTLDELSRCKPMAVALGGATHFITTPNEVGSTQTIGWGQGCVNGELGLGPGKNKSSTQPTEIEMLKGVDVIDVAGGQFTTLFLARPNAQLGELDRYPVHIESPDVCLVCNEKGPCPPMECERCDAPYHYQCLDPPLDAIPECEWFCPECEKEEADVGPEGEEVSLEVNGDTHEDPGTPVGTPVGRLDTPTKRSIASKRGAPSATPPKRRGSAGPNGLAKRQRA